MNNGALASIPSSECNDFLLAIISEAPNGTQLTVLSALAQANVDPWEEAARLSAMPKVTAEKALVSMFDRIPGRDWSPSEEATIAARLVELLPREVVVWNRQRRPARNSVCRYCSSG